MTNRSLMEQIAAGLLKYDLHEQVRHKRQKLDSCNVQSLLSTI